MISAFIKDRLNQWWTLPDTLARIERLLQTLNERTLNMANDLTALKAQVARTTEIEQSAIVLIQGLAEQIAASKDNPAAIQALADELSSKADALAAAVSANINTPPAAPAPPVE